MEVGMYRLRYVAVALVAGTVGAAVALLLAPDTGRNTRRKVMRRLQREREALLRQGRDLAEDAGEYVEARLKDGRKIVGRVVDDVSDDVAERIEKGKKKITKFVGA
jgi:gas vesicle protein